ncbi:DNA-directed RNA polymerase subunit omega [uncultured Ruminococcus sp.]|nr:DNA-directed RNA polymerase subunit omega [Massiliimalia timonensis]SCH37163.1 DNA-directed RNA polymerase subunit omega [uncultured Ruminococcus sp.]SCH39154.1 DNA-directed RNA polymerase subunit omega [uncultured Clostridium sp.]
MMHRPASTEILKNGESYYSLVIAVAKRAREIAEDAEEQHTELLEKPVQVAVEEFAKGKYKLVEQEGIGEKAE